MLAGCSVNHDVYYGTEDEQIYRSEFPQAVAFRPSGKVNRRQWRTQEFCSGGVQQIQLRTEDRENGDMGR